jgi:tetratricopeptide (TPR) repeat protein
MSPRARNWLVVGAIALLAAGATVGATLATRTGTGGSTAAPTVKQKGAPELDIDLGVRTDPEAVALRHALKLYAQDHRTAAGAIFARYRSLDAQICASLADWPGGFNRLAELQQANPGSSLAQLELGLAFFWQGRLAQAESAWRGARKAQPDTSYAVRAEDLLYPSDFPGLPPFSPSFALPPHLAGLSSPQYFAAIKTEAKDGGEQAKLLYGAALQKLGRPVSAEKQFEAALALAPNDVDARVAVAVGAFDKAKPAVAFSRLGPLVRVYPKAVTVRFHLGLMLLWIGQAKAAKAQLQKVVASGPSPFLADAQYLLKKLSGK